MAGVRFPVRGILAAAAALALAASGLTAVASRADQESLSPAELSPEAKEQVRAGVLKAPLAFVANTGALDPRVAFWLPGSQASVYLTDAGLTYRLSKPDAPAWVVRQDFVGAAATRPVALEKARPPS